MTAQGRWAQDREFGEEEIGPWHPAETRRQSLLMKLMKKQFSVKRLRVSNVLYLLIVCAVIREEKAVAQVVSFALDLEGQFSQTTANPGFVPSGSSFWTVLPLVYLTSAGDATSGTVTFSGSASPLTLSQSPQSAILLLAAVNGGGSLAATDSIVPLNTAYNFSINGGALGVQAGSLSRPASHFLPASIPEFSNFDQIQQIDPANAFNFQWNSLVPNGVAQQSVVTIIVRDQQTSSAVLDSGALPANTTSYAINGGTLAPNKGYNAFLVFTSQINSGNWNGGSPSGIVEEEWVTLAQFTTVPEPVSGGLVAGCLLIGAVLWRRLRKQKSAIRGKSN